MPLFGNKLAPRLRSDTPYPGFLFEMADKKGANVLVLVTAHALAELDRNRKPFDQFSGREIFDANRHRIEKAASRKFDARGTNEVLDGRPVLLVQSMDLSN